MSDKNNIYIYCKRKSNHYLSQKELFDEYMNSISAGKCSDKLLSYFSRLAKRIATTFEYVNYQDLHAVVNYAISEAWQKWDSFDPERSNNIFSFYTTMIMNDMRNHYKEITRGKELNISIESLFTSKD